MINWIIRPLLGLSGVIAAWFVASDSPNFEIVRALFAIVILVACLTAAAYWPWHRSRSKSKPGDDER